MKYHGKPVNPILIISGMSLFSWVVLLLRWYMNIARK